MLRLIFVFLALIATQVFAESSGEQALKEAESLLDKDPVSGLQHITRIEAEIHLNDTHLIPQLNILKAEAQILLSQFDQARELIESTLDDYDLSPNQRAKILALKGDLLSVTGQEREAYKWLNQAAKSVLIEGEPALMSEIIASRAVLAVNLNDLKQASDDIELLQALSKQLKNSMHLGNIYYAIAFTREGFEEYEDAALYFEQALEIFKQFQNEQQVSTLEYYLGRVYLKVEQPDKAIEYFQSSLESAQSSGDLIGEAFAYWGIARALELKDELNSAISYLKAADIILENSSNVEIKLGVLTVWSRVARKTKDYNEAKQLIERADLIAERFPDQLMKSKLELQMERAKLLYAVQEYSLAYDTIFKYTEMNVEYFESRREQAVQVARERQQTDIKEKEYQLLYKQKQAEELALQQQKQDNKLLLLILFILGFCCFGFALLLKRNHVLKNTLEDLAITDELTQIANRRFVMQTLVEEFDRAQRYATPLSICIFDIDYFKKLNDSLGHVVGDEILKKVSRIASDCIRVDDVVGRIGGEEFLIVFPHANLEEAYKISERLRKSIAIATYPGAHNAQPTISCGVTELQPSDSMDNILHRADKLLYEAKHNGRNLVVKE